MSEPKAVSRAGRPPVLRPADEEWVLAQVKKDPSVSLRALAEQVHAQLKRSVSAHTLGHLLRAHGLRKVRRPRDGRSTPLPPHGYQDAHRREGSQRTYPSSCTDAEWELLAPLFQRSNRRGRPEKYPRRLLLDAISYVVRSGCAWRMLPNDFPPWQLVYATFRRWAAAALFERMHDVLRDRWRQREQRDSQPTASVLDSQSVRTAEKGGVRGFDAGKKIKGRKRHLVTDTLGLLLAVHVHSAGVQDREGAAEVLARVHRKYPTLRTVFVDRGYEGSCRSSWERQYGWSVQVSRSPQPDRLWHHASWPAIEPAPRFTVQPKRWVIERTHAWTGRPRRMAKDYDVRLDVSEAWIWLVHACLLVQRLAATL